jgi:predicted PurR-regulated permease PerM
MTIYNIFDYAESNDCEGPLSSSKETHNRENYIQDPSSKKDRFLSAFFARMFFLCLLAVDLVWGAFSIVFLTAKLSLSLLTAFKCKWLTLSLKKSLLAVKRSIVCSIALTIAIISPALGIMFSCMYFLMYDKKGVDEIVPSSLKSHFKEILPSSPFA